MDHQVIKPIQYYSVRETLSYFRVPELRDIAANLMIQIPSKLRKADIIDVIDNCISSDPSIIVKQAFSYELSAFRDIMEGRMDFESADDEGWIDRLNRFGLIYAIDSHYKNEIIFTSVCFQYDIATKIHDLINDELSRRNNSYESKIEKLIIGLANIYGAIPIDYLQNRLGVLLGLSCDAFYIPRTIIPLVDKYGGKTFVFSPFIAIADRKNYLMEIREGLDITEYPIETVLEFGNMPYPTFSSKTAAALTKVLKQNRNQNINTEQVMREIWLTHQSNDFNSQDIINILPPVNSTDQISALLEATFNFSNSLPSWRLKGQSPQDAFMASRPTLISDSNIHMGPNLQAAGIHSVAQLREMAARGEEIPFTPPVGKKPGRNDPCPCGSGKKYKHCCGR